MFFVFFCFDLELSITSMSCGCIPDRVIPETNNMTILSPNRIRWGTFDYREKIPGKVLVAVWVPSPFPCGFRFKRIISDEVKAHFWELGAT